MKRLAIALVVPDRYELSFTRVLRVVDEGRYHLRIRDAEGGVVAEWDFEVERTPGRVTIP